MYFTKISILNVLKPTCCNIGGLGFTPVDSCHWRFHLSTQDIHSLLLWFLRYV